jgi:hypothetical protein
MTDMLDSDVISHPESLAAGTAHVIMKPSEVFILQECKQLRDEIWTRVQDQRSTERYMLLACAVIYSFLFIQGEKHSEEVLIVSGWYVPPLLAFLAAARWCENVQCIHLIADYTERQERRILGRGGGWESYLKKMNKGQVPVLVSGHYVAFWMFLIFATTTIAAYQHCSYLTAWKLSAALAIGVFATIVALVLMAQPVRSLVSLLRLQRALEHAKASAKTPKPL